MATEKATNAAMDTAIATLAQQNNMYVQNGYMYPMGADVVMGWGDDEDVPVAYASYIYKKPGQWEAHAYGMKACGPVGHIAKAYASPALTTSPRCFAVQGEFVKNLRSFR